MVRCAPPFLPFPSVSQRTCVSSAVLPFAPRIGRPDRHEDGQEARQDGRDRAGAFRDVHGCAWTRSSPSFTPCVAQFHDVSRLASIPSTGIASDGPVILHNGAFRPMKRISLTTVPVSVWPGIGDVEADVATSHVDATDVRSRKRTCGTTRVCMSHEREACVALCENYDAVCPMVRRMDVHGRKPWAKATGTSFPSFVS